jgi:hypothetical protein
MSSYAKLMRLLNRHIGNLGDKTHATASDEISGFMPPDLFKGTRQMIRKRSWRTGDLMLLTPGYYTGVGFINGPYLNTDWVCDIDITNAYDGRKEIIWYDNYGRKIYHTSVRQDGVFEWSKFEQNVLIWANTDNIATPKGSNIIVDRQINVDNDISGFEFVYKNISNGLLTSIRQLTWDACNCTFMNMPNTEADSDIFYYSIGEMQIQFDGIDTFNILSNRGINIQLTDNTHTRVDNPIQLIKIIGIR